MKKIDWQEIISQVYKGNSGVSPIADSRKVLSQSVKPLGKTQFDLDTDQANAIIQRAQKGFQIIDIQPNALTRTENFCVLKDEQIIEIIGSQNEGASAGATVDSLTSNYSMVPYWRSVQLPIVGTYLKIEFLPTIFQGLDSFYAPANNIQNAYYDAQNCDSTFQMQDAHRYAGSRMILLNFEDISSKPILVEDGQEFFTPFTNIILTFKQLSPRIRITVGFNTSLRTSKDVSPKNLHMWGTSGLLDKNILNPSSFCITDRDIDAYSNGKGITVTALDPVVTKTLISAYNNTYTGTNKMPDGVSVFWLTNFKMSIYPIGFAPGAPEIRNLESELFIYDNNTTSLIKRVASKNSTLILPYVGATTYYTVIKNDDSELGEPIRVVLKPNQELRIRVSLNNNYIGTSDTTYVKFSVSGYSLGRLVGSDAFGLVTPFNLNLKLTDNPYNSDFDYQYQPRT